MPSADAPLLEVFYASTCEPCRRELPALAQSLDDVKMVIYVLGKPDAAKRELTALSPALADKAVYVSPGMDRRTTLRQAGNADGILPFARSIKPDGALCAVWRGILTPERIRTPISLCGAPARNLP